MIRPALLASASLVLALAACGPPPGPAVDPDATYTPPRIE
jgi:hypothetical protein